MLGHSHSSRRRPLTLSRRALVAARARRADHPGASDYGIKTLLRIERPLYRRLAYAGAGLAGVALVVGGDFVVLAEALSGTIAFQERWVDPLLGRVGTDLLADILRDGGVLIVVTLTVLMLGVELRSQQRLFYTAKIFLPRQQMISQANGRGVDARPQGRLGAAGQGEGRGASLPGRAGGQVSSRSPSSRARAHA